MNSAKNSLRAAIVACLDASPTYLTAIEVSRRTGISYKSVIDALSILHSQERIVRVGRKFSSRWGSLALVEERGEVRAWDLLQAVWFGSGVRLR